MSISVLFGYLGYVGLVVGVVAALSNRQIRQERIEHLDGMVDILRDEMKDRDDRCERRLKEMGGQLQSMSEEHARLKGQVESLANGIGEKIGAKIAEAILTRMPK